MRVIAIPAGEASKNMKVLSDVYDALSVPNMCPAVQYALVTLSGGVRTWAALRQLPTCGHSFLPDPYYHPGPRSTAP